MDSDSASIDIDDHEIWEQRRARLKALESVNKPHRQAEFKFRLNQLLHTAAKNGDVDKFIEVLEKYSAEEGVSLSDILDMRGPSGNSLLHVAAGIEKANILRALLEVIHDKQLATKVNYRGDTALHVAARAGRIRMVELLIDGGSIADIANDTGNTALHEAVKNGHYELTRLLLRRGSRLVNQENKESKCPLYLAVEMGDVEILKLFMGAVDGNEDIQSRIQGMSPVHGAVMHQRIAMLKEMSKRKKDLFDLKDAGDGTPLHQAALMNYIDEVKFLVHEFPWSAFEGDKEGHLPIHVACKMGHLETIEELLRHWPDPEEWLNFKDGQNVLHVAAKYRRASVVLFILGDPKLEKLINAKDGEGNTPLHVATLHWQSEVLLSLALDYRVDRGLVNNNNLTALDIVDEKLEGIDAPMHRLMTRHILVNAGAPRSKDKAIYRSKGFGSRRDLQPEQLDRLRDLANTRMVVATLIATMTFAAGFSVPGGFKGTEPDAGIAALLNKPMYGVFVICNTVAMYNSIIAVVILLWAQFNDPHAVFQALNYSMLPLLIALATMCEAFMAGVYVTVSKRTWVAHVAVIVGSTALFIIPGLFLSNYWVQFNSAIFDRRGQLFIRYFTSVTMPLLKSAIKGRAKPTALWTRKTRQ